MTRGRGPRTAPIPLGAEARPAAPAARRRRPRRPRESRPVAATHVGQRAVVVPVLVGGDDEVEPAVGRAFVHQAPAGAVRRRRRRSAAAPRWRGRSAGSRCCPCRSRSPCGSPAARARGRRCGPPGVTVAGVRRHAVIASALAHSDGGPAASVGHPHGPQVGQLSPISRSDRSPRPAAGEPAEQRRPASRRRVTAVPGRSGRTARTRESRRVDQAPAAPSANRRADSRDLAGPPSRRRVAPGCSRRRGRRGGRPPRAAAAPMACAAGISCWRAGSSTTAAAAP